MHLAQAYISSSFISASSTVASAVSSALNGQQASYLSSHLNNDSKSYIFSSLLSLADAINGLNKSLWTWSTVKLYYTVFYALRSHLASNDECIFYIGSKPMGILARAGNYPIRLDGPTHKVVLQRFQAVNPHHFLLSQDIDLSNPFNWLMEKREDANYKNSRFYEPDAPPHFIKLSQLGLRQLLSAYLGDDFTLYMFDKDHAMLAYPLIVLREVISILKLKNKYIDVDDNKYLKQFFIDKAGPLPEIYNLIN